MYRAGRFACPWMPHGFRVRHGLLYLAGISSNRTRPFLERKLDPSRWMTPLDQPKPYVV